MIYSGALVIFYHSGELRTQSRRSLSSFSCLEILAAITVLPAHEIARVGKVVPTKSRRRVFGNRREGGCKTQRPPTLAGAPAQAVEKAAPLAPMELRNERTFLSSPTHRAGSSSGRVGELDARGSPRCIRCVMPIDRCDLLAIGAPAPEDASDRSWR
jgi:hypothetical protein